jgi:hypothetical protein
MKQIILLLLLIPILAFGQKPEQNNNSSTSLLNEFGLNLYSMRHMRYAGIEEKKKNFNKKTIIATHSFINGLYYKHYFGKNGLRTSFDLFQSINFFDFSSWNDGYLYNTNLKAGELKIGYERLFMTKKIIPFAFVDFIYNYSKEKGFCTAFWRQILNEEHQIGGGIGLGLGYKPIKNLVLSIEINFQIYYSLIHDLEDSWKYESTVFKFNPVRQFSIGLII